MPVEKWSDSVVVAHLADDPQFSEDILSIEDEIEVIGKDVVLDLADVEFLNSSNLARLLSLRKQISARHHRLLLCSTSDSVWGTFRATGLDAIFEKSSNVATALATLQMA